MPYPVIHFLNNDILLSVFNCYRLDNYDWNYQLLWCKLSHVCQRWRHLIYECASHLGIHIIYTRGTAKAEVLDHLPTVPLLLQHSSGDILPEQDMIWIYHVLRSHHDCVRSIDLDLLPSILDKVVVFMGEHFPILNDLSLSFVATAKHRYPLTLPKTFLAPNLRYLALPDITPPRRLRLLTSTVSLVTLKLENIQLSSYFRPRLLAARLRSLPQLDNLSIAFSTPILRPSTERELLGEQGSPVTLPSLKFLQFEGVGAYLDSLVAQIKAPLLNSLTVYLFNQIAFALPHLFYMINVTEAFKPLEARVGFRREKAYISTEGGGYFFLNVICKPFDWQINCIAQICQPLIPALSGVRKLKLGCFRAKSFDGGIDNATWYDLLRSFIGVMELHIDLEILNELSDALQVDEVGLDPEFLPNLRTIHAERNLFNSFIHTRQIVGRPVRFQRESSDW